MKHAVYLVPGMFGFSTLAGYQYFHHLEKALSQSQQDAAVSVVTTLPTASIRQRALSLEKAISERESQDPADSLHLIGHSTGGLEIRFLLSSATQLLDEQSPPWLHRVDSAVTINTPHYGTPLADYFTSAAGARLLYAVSLVTIVALRVGNPGLAALAQGIAAIDSIDDALGLDSAAISRATNAVLRFVDDDGRDEIKEFLDSIRHDRGGLYQVTPQSMDLFNVANQDRDGVRYGYVATAAERPGLNAIRAIRTPLAAASAALFATMYTLTGQARSGYAYPEVSGELASAIGIVIGDDTSDGIVPTASMPWGQLVWGGQADHLDVVGHCGGSGHADWMCSGTQFDPSTFESMAEKVSTFCFSALSPGS